jgi:hypothetical protein
MKRPQQRVATAKMAMAKGIADDDRDVRSTGLIFLLDKGSAVGWRNAEDGKEICGDLRTRNSCGLTLSGETEI